MAEFKPVKLSSPGHSDDGIAVEVLPYGLTIHKLLVQTDGRIHDIVIGPENPTDHVAQKYTNSIVGRYVNRVPVGTHSFERNGVRGDITALPNESPLVSLHGGPKGFDAVPWTLLTEKDALQLFSKAEAARIRAQPESSFAVFRLESPSGDQGYPGSLIVEVLVALISPDHQQKISENTPQNEVDNRVGSLALVYRAKLREANAVTPVNLTQHWGFNLEASLNKGPETLSVKHHTLTIQADKIAELDSDSLFTGRHVPLTPAHTHQAKPIGKDFPEKGYDDYYLFKDDLQSAVPTRIPLSSFNDDSDFVQDLLRSSDNPERGLRGPPAIELASERSGLKLLFDTNQRGTMFYSNALAKSSAGARKKIHGGSGVSGSGDAYDPHTAVFLELHHPLAAFLHTNEKAGEDTLLTSEELYHNYVRVDITSKQSPA
ncbi:galactose mutarotase-like domain-containing protein [Crepidotus variabilis]|uniref:Galactose mutarotase-like domain-containing protein n=1 Tax=Crepidotus variabilis TaxID=179855 RepID=A0A9P6ES97_9AGAR|nr:galactose mutarotase-like domain-containing protein [Crepidotus variabilis]